MSKTGPTKKPYSKPELRCYGDVSKLTEQLVASTGAADGGFYGAQQLKTGG